MCGHGDSTCPFTGGECATGGGSDLLSHITLLVSSCLALYEELNRFIMELVKVPLKREKKCEPWGFLQAYALISVSHLVTALL